MNLKHTAGLAQPQTDRFSSNPVTRRGFLLRSTQAAAGTAAALSTGATVPLARGAEPPPGERPAGMGTEMPYGKLGEVKISRLLLGGNLVAGYMHCRDLKYVGALFRAYVTEQKLMETFQLAEQQGINTVFETGAEYVRKYNRQYGGRMQFIPHIKVEPGQSDEALRTHILQQVDTGACALYVWGVAGDRLVQAGAVERLAKAVELAKTQKLPVGVGGHSLQVPMTCEKHRIPCDFYVKTFHSDNYPSATPKALRKDFMWLDGGEGWYDNMWCINAEETVAFMQTVTKPWLAFKVLAAGAIYPRDAFLYAFRSGADFIAVGMLDFQIRENCDLTAKVVRLTQKRERPWLA
ncbi:MAG: hypothetical protein FJ387_15060 [Verrucomicrobia bacterium]|nr:hypothetical protein [Verrucomicrobiota bacterium]